jgi:hypothetical protein
MSQNAPKVPVSSNFLFCSRAGFDQPGKIAGEYGSNIRCIYIQVQKVYVLYLFLRNPGIFLKKYFREACLEASVGHAGGRLLYFPPLAGRGFWLN